MNDSNIMYKGGGGGGEISINIIFFCFRIKVNDSNVMYKGCEDDGEIHAGSRLLHLLEVSRETNGLSSILAYFCFICEGY